MFGRVVVEGEQLLLFGGDLGDCLGPLGRELGSEGFDGLSGLGLVLGTGVISLMALLALLWTLFGRASRTFEVLCTQSRCWRVSGITRQHSRSSLPNLTPVWMPSTHT